MNDVRGESCEDMVEGYSGRPKGNCKGPEGGNKHGVFHEQKGLRGQSKNTKEILARGGIRDLCRGLVGRIRNVETMQYGGMALRALYQGRHVVYFGIQVFHSGYCVAG